MYAQITDNAITATRSTLPDKARRLDNGDWVLGFPAADDATMAACGWARVVETVEPPYDPDTHKVVTADVVVDGRPVRQRKAVALTADEVTARTKKAADDQERDQVRQMVDWLTSVAQDANQSTENRRFARILRALIRDQYGE